MDELAEKIYDAVLAFVEDVDSGKLSMKQAEGYAIGYISTEISEYLEQRQEPRPHETIVIGKTMTAVSMGVLGKNAVAKYLFEDSKKAAKFLIEKGYEIVDDNKAYNKDFAEWARIDTVVFKGQLQ